MPDNYSNYSADEVEIDLIDLIKVLVTRWKSIILCAVVFMVLVSGLYTVKSMFDSKSLEEPLTQEIIDADIREAYQELLEQYDDNLKMFEMKPEILNEYSQAVEMLDKELENLSMIPESDETARLESLVKISTLQSVLNNASSMRSKFVDLKRPEEPVDFEEFEEVYLTENQSEIEGDQGFDFSIKYTVAGFILGGFIACFGWAMVYLMDGKIKTVSEVIRSFNVNALGAPDKQGLVAANVKNFMTDDVNTIFITCSGSDADSSESIEKISSAVKNMLGDIKVISAVGLNYNADTAAMLSDADAVVLVEKLKCSKHSSVAEEIMMIRNAGKKLIGVAV